MQQNKLGFKNLRPGQQYEVTIRTSTAAGLALPGNTSGQFINFENYIIKNDTQVRKIFTTLLDTPSGLNSQVIDQNSLGVILSWNKIKARPFSYIVNLGPEVKSCGRFHNEPVR